MLLSKKYVQLSLKYNEIVRRRLLTFQIKTGHHDDFGLNPSKIMKVKFLEFRAGHGRETGFSSSGIIGREYS
jgi:hypothetical protein